MRDHEEANRLIRCPRGIQILGRNRAEGGRQWGLAGRPAEGQLMMKDKGRRAERQGAAERWTRSGSTRVSGPVFCPLARVRVVGEGQGTVLSKPAHVAGLQGGNLVQRQSANWE